MNKQPYLVLTILIIYVFVFTGCEGVEQARKKGYEEAKAEWYQKGLDDGKKIGKADGHSAGFEEGESFGREEGKKMGYKKGQRDGYISGSTTYVGDTIIPGLGITVTVLLSLFAFWLLRILFKQYRQKIQNRYELYMLSRKGLNQIKSINAVTKDQRNALLNKSKHLLEYSFQEIEKLKKIEFENLPLKKSKQFDGIKEKIDNEATVETFKLHEDFFKAENILKNIQRRLIFIESKQDLSIKEKYIQMINDDNSIPDEMKLELLKKTVFK